jgi:NDP-sugar pyrophosphorylase family protein
VTVAGRTLLEITLQRLRSFDIRDVMINVHYFADMVLDYLKSNDNFGMHLEVSREDVLLDTGGGLKQAAGFFLDSVDNDQRFILHNVDVVSTIDLAKMLEFHSEQKALATLATQHRSSSRHLLFDGNNQLCGRHRENEPPEMVREATSPDAVGFCGVHVIDPKLLHSLTETGAFSIIDSYLRLTSRGESIGSFSADAYYWRDLGNPESISAAEVDYSKGLFI